MEENNKSGFTAEGRKLRPRRPRISDKVYSSNEGHTERRSFSSEDRHSSSSEGRSYGRRSYGSQDNSGGYGNSDRRSAGRPGSYNRSNGSSEGRGYGYSNDRNNSYSDRRSSFGRGGDRRSYGSSEGRSYGSSRAEVMDSRKDAAATATPREGVTAAVKAETSARQEEESHSIQTDRQEGLTAVLKEGRALKEEVSDRAEAAHSEARTTEAVSEADRLLRAETTSIQTESHRLSRIHINSAMLTSRI